ncbi:aldehyde dehydrogenase family protein [Streptomyces zagrosensis]|uniref:aldehyde dehydrogenase family protein n=1 Tax=Streptomyces zagrosensis TaxID=1042984 RepID=UPI0028A803E7|nr:aldehyde dehydrogenase family protein [Streptomyces zagrosensis]
MGRPQRPQSRRPPGVRRSPRPAGEQKLGRHWYATLGPISFTGSTPVGKRIGSLAGADVKRVALELGSKSASVNLPGADLAQTVRADVADVMRNAKQCCNTLTRTLVHADDHEEAVRTVVEEIASYVPGDPADPECRLDPVVGAPSERKSATISVVAWQGRPSLRGWI